MNNVHEAIARGLAEQLVPFYGLPWQAYLRPFSKVWTLDIYWDHQNKLKPKIKAILTSMVLELNVNNIIFLGANIRPPVGSEIEFPYNSHLFQYEDPDLI